MSQGLRPGTERARWVVAVLCLGAVCLVPVLCLASAYLAYALRLLVHGIPAGSEEEAGNVVFMLGLHVTMLVGPSLLVASAARILLQAPASRRALRNLTLGAGLSTVWPLLVVWNVPPCWISAVAWFMTAAAFLVLLRGAFWMHQLPGQDRQA
jgi:hypothetical protein